MRVLVDALPLLGQASIADYLRQLLHHLILENPCHEYRLLFRGLRSGVRAATRASESSPLSRLRTHCLPVPDRALEWCWTHRSMPLPLTETLIGRPDVFLSTVHRVPVLRGPQIVSIAYDLIPLRFPNFYGQDQPTLPLRLRRSIERSTAIIAISNSTKEDYVRLLGADPDRIHVVYPGVNPRFRPREESAGPPVLPASCPVRTPYLLYVGVLAPHKNVETLLRTFRRLKKERGIPHQLVLCGRTFWGQRIVESAQDLIRAGACAVLDYIPDPDLLLLYQAAEAVVLLSLFEGFGLPALEAMACGTPVIVSDVAALPEVVGDAGLLVDPTDDTAIEAALYRLLTDERLRGEMRLRGLMRASQFSWSIAAPQFLRVLENAARSS